MLIRIIITSIISLGFLASCSKQPVEDIHVDPYQPENTKPVASVSGDLITKGELDHELAFYSSNPHIFSDVNQMQVLGKLIEQQALYKKAVEMGFDQNPGFLIEQRKLLANQYKRYLKRQVEKNVLITDANLKEYFEENIAKFTTPAKLRFAVYQRKNSSKDQQKLPLDRLKKLVKGLPADEGFGRFAKDSDHKQTRHRGGKLAWLTIKGGMAGIPDAVIEKGRLLKNTGDISQVVVTDHGKFLVRLVDKKPALVADFAQQKANIRQKLLHERKQTMLNAYIENAVLDQEVTIIKANLISEQKEEAPHHFGPPGIAVK